jgi:DNA-binding beta-propeller fold protein YncE
MFPRYLTPALTALVTLATGLCVAGEPERTADLVPLAPIVHKRFGNFQHMGGMDQAFALSPNGKTLVIASHNSLVLFDLAANQPFSPQRNLQPENVFFYGASVAFSSDGKTVVAAPSQHGQDFTVHFVDITSGKVTHQIDNDQMFFGLAVSPDGKTLALAGQQNLELWDAASGEEIRVLPLPPNQVCRQVAFSPDGRTLAAAAAADGTVRLWEIATGKERDQFRIAAESSPQNPRFRNFNNSAVGALAFSRDGAVVAIGGNDGAVHLYDLTTRQELPPLSGHLGAVRAIAFTPDGRRLVSFDSEGVLLGWSAGRIRQPPPDRLPTLSEAELDELWNDLADADSFQTYRAARYLSADPGRAVALFRRHVRPVPAGDAARITQLVNDIQNPTASVRRKAMTELRKHGEAAYGALSLVADGRRHLPAVQSLMNRLEAQANTPDRQRSLKAVGILARIGSAQARALVEELAKGAPGVALTVEAKMALDRWASASANSAVAPASAETLWADLAREDAGRAYRAIHALAAAPQQALPLLRQHLKPASVPDARRLDRCLAELDSNDFAVRQKATEELAKLGVAAESAMRKALAQKPSLEARRRLKELLERLKVRELPTDVLRDLRALEVLERLDARDAEPLLEALARGAPEDRRTQEAQATLRRLSRPIPATRAAVP